MASWRIITVAVWLLGAATRATHGQTTNTWVSNFSSSWEVATNWSSNVPPDSTFALVSITNENTKTVTIDNVTSGSFPGTLTISNLFLSGPAGTVNTLSLTTPGTTVPLLVTNAFTIDTGGALQIQNGAVQVEGVNGDRFIVNGEALLSQASARLTTTNLLSRVGASGSGSVTVQAGIWRARDVNVGASGGAQGTLTVSGGTTELSSLLRIGREFDSTGAVWVTDGELTVTNADTYVGDAAIGQMTVSNGTWQARGVVVGRVAGSQGALTVAGGTNELSSNMIVGDLGTGAVWVTGGQLTVTNSETAVGNFGNGQITVSNGAWRARDLYVGVAAGSQGTLTVAGGTNMVSSTMSIAFAPGATGAVWVTGGQLTVTNNVTSVGNGQLTVSNGLWRARDVYVGIDAGSQGTLTVDGGTNQLSLNLTLGFDPGATGEVWVTGGELTVTNRETIVGESGNGQMTVSNGLWRARDAYVGDQPGSQGTLTLAGGTNQLSSIMSVANAAGATGAVWVTGGELTVTNQFTAVGRFGNGQMTVSNGLWRARDVYVGNQPGSQGALTLAGGTNQLSSIMRVGDQFAATGALWVTGGQLTVTNDATFVGYVGNGQLTVSNGTWRAREVIMGSNAGSQGALTVAGGTNELSSFLSVGHVPGAEASVWVTGGQLTVTNGETLVGVEGIAQMTVSNGTWRAQHVFVGRLPGSKGTLTVAGGTNDMASSLTVGDQVNTTGAVWVTGGQLTVTNLVTTVGRNGNGQMTVSNGTWRARNVDVGFNSGSQGTLTVAGGTSVLRSYLYVGFSGTGTVWMTGGELTVTNRETNVGYVGIGRMTVSNGTWQARDVNVGFTSPSHGTLTVAGGTNSVPFNLILGNSDCTATGIVIVTAGRLFVTNALADAVLDVRSGTFTQSGGLVQIDSLVITNACGRFVRSGGTVMIGTLDLTPGFDADGDGLTNSWEQMFGLDPLVATGTDGPTGDADGDGVSNAAEQAAGTDPVEFRVTSITREGDDIRVTWKTFGDNMYIVQTNAPPANGSFTNNFSDVSPPYIIPFGALAATTNHLDTGGALFTNRYYRVRLVP